MPARGDLSARTEGRRPKASEEGTRGGRATACRLWGFDDAAVCVVDALAGVIGGGSTIAVASWRHRGRRQGSFSLIDGIGVRLEAAGRQHATPEAGFPGGGRCNKAVMDVMASWL